MKIKNNLGDVFNIDNIINDFMLDTHRVEYAREYGVNECIEGFLYYTYEGIFEYEDINILVNEIEKKL